MSILKRGSQGAEVEQLQIRLRALGYYDGDIDGDFGPKTAAAVLAFQQAYEELVDDEIAGPLTQARIAQALVIKNPSPPPPPSPIAIVPCNAVTWAAFQRFIAVIVGAITGKPVRYGPGRGLFVGDKWVVTHGPGALGAKAWNGGQTFPSFHCSAFTNFVLGWLGRRNGDYTHAGNVPELWTLCEASADEHVVPQDGWVLRYRGYGDMCSPILTDGSTTKRAGISKVIDAKELLARARAGTLPTFVVFGQSTLINGKWLWWHHTGLFVVWENRLYRIAADGRYANGRWSGQPMQYVEITDQNVGNLAACVYRCYGVNTVDGTYGDQTRPIADVVFET